MQLRAHPALCNKGYRTWPPPWSTTRKDDLTMPVGEVGILKEVLMSDLAENTIFMRMEYQDKLYMGCLMLSDRRFCHHLYSVLKGLIGRSVEEVGDFDLSHTL